MSMKKGLGGAMQGASAALPTGNPYLIAGGAALGGLMGMFGDDEEAPDYSAQYNQAMSDSNAAYGRGYGYADQAMALGQGANTFAQQAYEGAQPGIARLRGLADQSIQSLMGTSSALSGYGERANQSFQNYALPAYDRAAQGQRYYEQDPYTMGEGLRMQNVGRAQALAGEEQAWRQGTRSGLGGDRLRQMLAGNSQRNVATIAGMGETGRRGAMERERMNDLQAYQAGLPLGQMATANQQASASLIPSAYNIGQAGLNADLPYIGVRQAGFTPGIQAASLGANLAAAQGRGAMSMASQFSKQGADAEDPFWTGMGALGGGLSNMAGSKGGLPDWMSYNGGGSSGGGVGYGTGGTGIGPRVESPYAAITPNFASLRP